MDHYRIHPIVMGTKIFDKSMMTYQHGYGETYTIPIYCWYLEGGEKKILVDTGEMHPIQSSDREAAIGGKIYTFEQGLAKWHLKPEDIDIVIHTHLHNDHCENDYK
jgi:N-acyl homoserine lactone hydrolase